MEMAGSSPAMTGGVARAMTRGPAMTLGWAMTLGPAVTLGAAVMTGASGCLAEQFAADQHAADFAGAGADFVELGVAQQASGRIVVDIAVAAEQLDRIKRALRRLL